MRQEIRDRILRDSDSAVAEAGRVLASDSPDVDFVRVCIYRYVCKKFLLDPDDSGTKDLSELAELSIERMLDLHIPLSKESETATTCGAAGTTAMKIALLLTAVKKDFKADIDPHRLGLVRDTDELGSLVWEARYGGKS
ncbi:MAG: hypothetical protein LUC17_00130 [Oscillospiraceae bacterium]|nr:hypothetical protein [Oscillospiraceae bacterium]